MTFKTLYGCDIKCEIIEGARIFLQPTVYETVLLSYINFVGVCFFINSVSLTGEMCMCVIYFCVFFCFVFSKARGRT